MHNTSRKPYFYTPEKVINRLKEVGFTNQQAEAWAEVFFSYFGQKTVAEEEPEIQVQNQQAPLRRARLFTFVCKALRKSTN